MPNPTKRPHVPDTLKKDKDKKEKKDKQPAAPAAFDPNGEYSWQITFLCYRPVASAPLDYGYFRHGALFFVPVVGSSYKPVPGGAVLAQVRGWVGAYRHANLPSARDYTASTNYLFAHPARDVTTGPIKQHDLIRLLDRVPVQNNDRSWTCQNWVHDVIQTMVNGQLFWGNSTQNAKIKGHLLAWNAQLKTVQSRGNTPPLRAELTEADKEACISHDMMGHVDMNKPEAVKAAIAHLDRWIIAKKEQDARLAYWCNPPPVQAARSGAAAKAPASGSKTGNHR